MPLPISRKRLHSQDDSSSSGDSTKSSSNVKVVVRIRPQNAKEAEGNFREVVQAVDENVLVFDPKENECTGGRKRPRDIRKRRNKDLNFAFDHVFGPNSTNMDIYNETTNSVLNGLLDGYNCSVFAYGATGAGKTFTMLGTKDHPGVMYHTMMDLYSRIENMKDTKTCDVAVSYLEIYNETICDLLMKTSALPIREDPGQGVVVQGLSLHKPKTAEELLYMLQYGNQNRTQHPTDANSESSRSHAVLQVFVRQKDRTANISTEVRIAKLCLVDLAGSERATATKNMGSRFREGANINKSLLALGNVINALAENKNKGYIPYRDSKLTRLLKDSLGGNCQTVMIAAVSPSAMTYEDTYNTLRYADRAKHIKATLKKNVLNVDFHMAKYGKIVEELRKEIFELKGKLKVYEEKKTAPAQVLVQADVMAYSEYHREINQFYSSHQSVRSDQLQQEITLRNLQWKIFRKERCLSRLSAVDEPGNIESVKAVDTMLNGMKQKCSCLSISSDSSRSMLTDSYKRLGDLEQNIYNSCATQDKSLPEVVSLSLKVCELQTQQLDSKQELSYMRQVVRCQEKELVHNERLIHLMLKLLKKQHYILKGHNILTSDLVDEYVGLQKRVGSHELCWGDQEEGAIYTRGYTLSTMLELPSMKLKKEDFKSTQTVPVENKQDVANKKNTVYEFTATQCPSKKSAVSYPYKVDECSPPKPKRVCLDNKTPQIGAARVDRHGNTQSQKRMNQSAITPIKSRHTPSKSQSFCVSRSLNNTTTTNNRVKDNKVLQSSVQNRGNTSSAKMMNNRKNHSRSASVGSSIDFENESSDSSAEFVKSRFSKLNDTISKKEKFSHLHVKPKTSLMEASKVEIDEADGQNLDGTFTIDPSVNDVSVSDIPCVDCADSQVCTKCDVLKKNVSKSVINLDSKSCVKCEKNCDSNQLHNGEGCNCSKLAVEPAQKYSSCIGEIQTGSQYGLENDSGASTIVNQSSNSVASLASVSTLIDGQNLSQNLSSTEESILCVGPASQNESKSSNTDTVKVTKCSSSNSSSQLGQTTTKGSVDNDSQKENKVKRSINFDSSQRENGCFEKDKSFTNSLCTPTTPTKDRKPLSLVGSCNTSLSSPRRDSGTFTSSDSDSSFTKRRSDEIGPLSQLLVNEKQSKENCRILSQHGLPSLVSGSIINTSKPPLNMKRSHSRGYLQTTKAHSNRTKQNSVKSHVRSKSSSNVSTKAAWQI